MTEHPQSFFRRWRLVILIGVPLIVIIVAMRGFVDHFSNAPITDPYLAVIKEMSLASPRARQRLEQYYAKHQRQTVASKHFPRLCVEMEELAAEDDGITLVRRPQDSSTLVWLPDKRTLACPTVFDFYEKP